jgi:hypothetical protein
MLARWLARTVSEKLGGMLLFRPNTASAEPDVWTASAEMRSDSNEVLCALTEPASIARWAPVSFDLDGLAGSRLRAGSRERVSGSIAGMTAVFEVEVTRADEQRLELVAQGPVSLDVAYRFSQNPDGVIVDARVAVRRQQGLRAQVLRAAVGALLNAGALGTALRRLERSLSGPYEAELLAA